MTREPPSSVQRKISGCWFFSEYSTPSERVMAITCSSVTPRRSFALSITALSTWPIGRSAARLSTVIIRVKCSSNHITKPPAATATPGQPYARYARATTTTPPINFTGLTAGTEMLGVVTEDNSDFRLTARQNAPIGHKIALTDLRKGDTILKYGEDIGRAIADIAKGEHVHVHNIKTKRW